MRQIYNPYLPLGVYIPDGEPHLFDGRVYIYGSHDATGAKVYCPGDYNVWSAPADDLTAGGMREPVICAGRIPPMRRTGCSCGRRM